MATRTVFLFVIFLSLAACQRPAVNSEQQQDTDAGLAAERTPEAVVTDEDAVAEREAQIAMELAERELGFIFKGTIRPGQLPNGTWYDQDGSRICDGFLTRNIDEDFCAPEVPSDWVPFEFDGQTYYVQPLSAKDD
jgi:hypothetical protein